MIPLLEATICGPRMAKEYNPGKTATSEGVANELPLSEDEVYIILSPRPYVRCIVPILSFAIFGICPFPITKSSFATAFFSPHEMKKQGINIKNKTLEVDTFYFFIDV